jgi:integrase
MTPAEALVAEYLDWGRAQGGRLGRPWARRHGRRRELDLAFWVERLAISALHEVRLADVERVCRSLSHLHPKSVDMKVDSLRACILWAVRRDMLPRNPLAAYRAPDTTPTRPHRALTDAEIEALFAAATPLRRLWYATALGTGFRVSELRQVRASDLDPQTGMILLDKYRTKSRKEARQPIPRALIARLVERAKEAPEGPLLGIPTSKSSRIIREDFEAAGIARVTASGLASWHSFRKTYVTRLVESGADIKTVMELARHSTPLLTLAVYAQRDEGRMREAVEGLRT